MDRFERPESRESRSNQGVFLLGLAAGLLAALAVERTLRYTLDSDIELVRAVRDMAMESFVREVEPTELVDDAVQGMLEGLDEYSHFYTTREVPGLDRETTGEFLGIGVVFVSGEVGRVLFAYPGSPAERAGLTVGDRILEVAGQTVGDLDANRLQGLIHTGGSPLQLLVEDLDGARRELQLTPEEVLDPTVRHVRMLKGLPGFGYLSIRSFSHRTVTEFDEAIARLQALGLRALVLDLRFNPGGILDSAVSIANRFVAAGPIVATRARTETRVTSAAPEQATLAGTPLIVLIDSGSASASEVLAAALQDHAAAVLVGEPSYGKGTVQTLKPLGRRRAVVKLTTANYCSPSLRRIEHAEDGAESNGIAPDLWVPLTEAERREIWRFQLGYSPPEEALEALRAWEQREGLELVAEPPSDRQLDAAVALLTGAPLELAGDPLP